jgi:CRISPR-associated protein Cas2
MYVILVYDVEQKRVAKMCKLLRRYLNWVQNSVFEGEITEAKLLELKINLSKIIQKDYDSLIIYKLKDNKPIRREIMGKEFNPLDVII